MLGHCPWKPDMMSPRLPTGGLDRTRPERVGRAEEQRGAERADRGPAAEDDRRERMKPRPAVIPFWNDPVASRVR
jgi:hypothetical protein